MRADTPFLRTSFHRGAALGVLLAATACVLPAQAGHRVSKDPDGVTALLQHHARHRIVAIDPGASTLPDNAVVHHQHVRGDPPAESKDLMRKNPHPFQG